MKLNFNLGPPAAPGAGRLDPASLDRLSTLGPEAAAHIRQLTERMPGGFFIYRAHGDEELLYANDALLRLFGCATIEEFQSLTGGTFRGMVHPDDLEEVEESIWEQIADNSYDLDYVEYRIVRRDGSVRWVEDYGHFARNDYVGDIFYVFLADATEKRQSQLAILGQKNRELEALSQEQNQNLEMIQGLSVDYETIFYLDLETDSIQFYRLSERVTEQLKGLDTPYSFDRFAGRYIQACVSQEDREMMRRVLSSEYLRDRLSRRSTYHMTYRIEGESGPEYLQLRCVNVDGSETANRVVMGVRLVDNEIVLQLDQKRLLEEALQQARAAEIARNTFLSNMSHDIRTPLNAIMGLVALARTHAGDPERVRDYMERIEEAGGQLLDLLSDVLELSQLESGKVSIEEKPCLLADVVADVENKIRPKAVKKGISFSVDLSGIKNGDVYGDRARLVEVLLCLVGNAVKYTLPGGQVTLCVYEEFREMRDYSVCCFRVEDTGVGISPAFIKYLYEPFERERSTTLSGVQGTGLGLPIAKSLVDRMGGTLAVKSEPGKGTVFTLTLSMRLHHPESGEAGQEEAGSNAFAGMRLLLVEDNQINIMIETELLQDAGFEVDVAENGQIAVNKVRNSTPGDYQLILMDIQMPVMDGREATRAIRALKDEALAAIPIVALSANAFDKDVRQSLECGMEAHLPKPLYIPQLLEQIARIMGEKKS